MTRSADEAHVGLVVEGPGDVRAVPVLLRHWRTFNSMHEDVLGKPVSCNGRPNALRKDGLEKFVITAASRPGAVGVLIVLDAETDAACKLGPELLARAKNATPKPVSVALADSCYEAWLFASAETLQLGDLTYGPRKNPRSAIKRAVDGKYIKPTWQPRLTARLDFELAQSRSASLTRMLKRFDEMSHYLPEE